MMSTGQKIGIAMLLLLGALIVAGFTSCRTVDGGFVGVKKTWGSIHDAPVEEGLHFVVPVIQTIVSMDTRLKSFETEPTSASSKDLQVVTTQISVQHWLNAATAPMAFAAWVVEWLAGGE